MKIAQHWRLNPARYQMEASKDEDGRLSFPPRPGIQQRAETRYVFVNAVAQQETPQAEPVADFA